MTRSSAVNQPAKGCFTSCNSNELRDRREILTWTEHFLSVFKRTKGIDHILFIYTFAFVFANTTEMHADKLLGILMTYVSFTLALYAAMPGHPKRGSTCPDGSTLVIVCHDDCDGEICITRL